MIDIKVKYAGQLGKLNLELPTVDIAVDLAQKIRSRMLQGRWVSGGRQYSKIPDGVVWAPPNERLKANGNTVRQITKGKWAGWYICNSKAAYTAAGGVIKNGMINFARTGELWSRLTVRAKANGSSIMFSGKHRGANLRSDRLARALGKIYPAGLLAFTPDEFAGVQSAAIKSVEQLVSEQLQRKQLGAISRLNARNRRLSKLLGD